MCVLASLICFSPNVNLLLFCLSFDICFYLLICSVLFLSTLNKLVNDSFFELRRSQSTFEIHSVNERRIMVYHTSQLVWMAFLSLVVCLSSMMTWLASSIMVVSSPITLHQDPCRENRGCFVHSLSLVMDQSVGCCSWEKRFSMLHCSAWLFHDLISCFLVSLR